MKNAEMKVVRFSNEDVIVTSGLKVSLSGALDGTSYNIGYEGDREVAPADKFRALSYTGELNNATLTYSELYSSDHSSSDFIGFGTPNYNGDYSWSEESSEWQMYKSNQQ